MLNLDPQHTSEFTLNLLILITRLAAKGDYPTMQKLGIRADQIDKLQALSTQEIQQMALITKTRFVSIQFDADALDMAINLGSHRVERRNVIYALLKGGATKPILHKLFGLSSLEMANLRRFMSLPKADGRPPVPTEQQEHDLWHAWQQVRTQETDLAKQLLELHEKTGIKVNVIWPLLQDWSTNHSAVSLRA